MLGVALLFVGFVLACSSRWVLFFVDGCTRVQVQRCLAPSTAAAGIATRRMPYLPMLPGRW